MPRQILWTDAEEIGIQLAEKFPGLDPLGIFRAPPGTRGLIAVRGSWDLERRSGKNRPPFDAHLDEDAGHQGGDVAGRDRMGRRQPGVQRHDARLDAEADQKEQKSAVAPEQELVKSNWKIRIVPVMESSGKFLSQ